jgi:hypothetical protein
LYIVTDNDEIQYIFNKSIDFKKINFLKVAYINDTEYYTFKFKNLDSDNPKLEYIENEEPIYFD